MNEPQRTPQPQKAPARPWYEKPRTKLAPEEVDDLDRRLGRVQRSKKLFQ